MLVLIRHPRPMIASGICYGQSDVPVSDDEVRQAVQVLTPQLQALNVNFRLVSSPLQRCLRLADTLAKPLNLQITDDSRLQEIDFGDWEGKAWNDIPRHEIDAWAADVADYAPPNGESVQQLRERVLSWLREIEISTESWIMVTHAGVIRVLLGVLNDLPFDKWSQLPIGFASLTVALHPRKMLAYA